MNEQHRERDIRKHVRERVGSIRLGNNEQLNPDSAVKKLNKTLSHLDRRRKGEVRSKLDRDQLSRRDFLKLLGATSLGAAAAFGFVPFLRRELDTMTPTGYAASDNVDLPGSVDVSQHADGYEVWTVQSGSKAVVRPGGSFTVDGVLIDQTASGASFTFIPDQSSGWTIRNVGYRGRGAGQEKSASGQHIKFHSEGGSTVENIYINALDKNTQMGGIGTVGGRCNGPNNIIKNTFIAGMGNNASYCEQIHGELTFRYCFHWNNTVSQFRPNSSGAVVENCVAYINADLGARGGYFDPNGSRNARGVWTRTRRCKGACTVRNSSFYISPTDPEHGASIHSQNCPIELGDGVQVGGAEHQRGDVRGSIAGNTPTFDHLGDPASDGGIPISPEMAARGERAIPDASDFPGMGGGPGTGAVSPSGGSGEPGNPC